jgi:hypothetical protein
MSIDAGDYLSYIVSAALVAVGVYEGWKRLPAIKLPSWRLAAAESSVSSEPSPEEDRHTVLAIQGRLKAAGNQAAADTAYQLLGEMLAGAKPVQRQAPERHPL